MFKLFFTVWMSPLLVWAMERPTCLFLFDGKPVYEIEKPILSHFGLEPIKENARVAERRNAFGTTYLVSEDAAIRLREVLNSGVITQELFVGSEGRVTFTSWEKQFRNTITIPAESAEELIRQLDYALREGAWALALAAAQIYKGLEVYESNLTAKNVQSDVWTLVSHIPPVWTQLERRVGQEHRHLLGVMHLIFDPKKQCVVWQSMASSGHEWEQISLFADGTAKRLRSDGGSELIAHMDSQIAEGIMAYAYYHSSLGGWNFLNALQKLREFVLGELPELFVSELPFRRNQAFFVPTDQGMMAFEVNNTPDRFDPALGVNQ